MNRYSMWDTTCQRVPCGVPVGSVPCAPMTSIHPFFATTLRGQEGLLKQELENFGAVEVGEKAGGVVFSGDLEVAYRACLWSRIAGRILLPIARYAITDQKSVYQGAKDIAWHAHLEPERTFAIDFSNRGGPIDHSHYGSQLIKDAVVDSFRESHGVRPSVDVNRPDVLINVFVTDTEAVISIDMSGDSLHKRGYRMEGGHAPLKEHQAAAILLRAKWPDIAAQGEPLLDPMCGSGTFLIEGAMIAGDIAPGLLRDRFGFHGWLLHDEACWQKVRQEAEERRAAGILNMPLILGSDNDKDAIISTRENATRAGVVEFLTLSQRDVTHARPPKRGMAGLIVCNAPYGVRIGEADELPALFSGLGDTLKKYFGGWRAFILLGDAEHGKALCLRAERRFTMFNGPLECTLLDIPLYVQEEGTTSHRHTRRLSTGAPMFEGRLKKNAKHLAKWAKRQKISCYRVYDSDIPEYAVAVDIYGNHAVVQEYQAPQTVDEHKAAVRVRDVMAIVPEVLGFDPKNVHLKVRKRQRGVLQYEKTGTENSFVEVQESGLSFFVNFTDYLDTGLFLDHRLTRGMLASLSKNRDMLNLFAYTGSASAYAALGGARSTTTVDMSATYLDWAAKNMRLNGFRGPSHQFIQADCVTWVQQEKKRYGLIFLDPPTFSNSKRMEDEFDIQRDHVKLIHACANLLTPDGILIFSTNNRRFKLDHKPLRDLTITDITEKTIPEDFGRNKRIHMCFKIEHKKPTEE